MEYAPAQDRKGRDLQPGDRVSFKLYPRGTGEGVVVISPRAKEVLPDGSMAPALVIDSDGRLYGMPPPKGVLKLEQKSRLAWSRPSGERTQDGNIVVVTTPDRKGYEVYEVDRNGLEMYYATIPVGQDDRIKDTKLRWAVQKHIKKFKHSLHQASEQSLRSATIRLAHANPELRPHLLPLLKEAKTAAGKTYAEAKTAVMDYLKSKGWKLSAPGLKVPHATSPDGKIRFWFKTQAVYFTNGNQHNLNGARTVSYDTDEIKKKTPQQYVEDAEAFARRED